MHRSIPCLLIAAFALAPCAASAEERPPFVTVTGTGSVSAAPDRAQIQAGVVTEAPRAAEAVAATSAAMQKVLAALDAAGIDRKQVQTSRFDVSPVYADMTPETRGMPAIRGYRASNQVQVEVRDIAKIGGVLDALVGAGANEIGGISFSIADSKPLEDQARKQAVADARRKAELYAAATATTLGRVLAIDESGGGPSPFPARHARMEAAAAPPIAPGELDLAVTVTVTWSLAP
jgi:uncharacterized protein YggE